MNDPSHARPGGHVIILFSLHNAVVAFKNKLFGMVAVLLDRGLAPIVARRVD